MENSSTGSLKGNHHVDLHRELKARHITMIAIGGAIGMVLFIGTGSALAKAGPASVLIAYLIVGFIMYLVMYALGEMVARLLPFGFTGYAMGFCLLYAWLDILVQVYYSFS